jgi:hypothetical protein
LQVSAEQTLLVVEEPIVPKLELELVERQRVLVALA